MKRVLFGALAVTMALGSTITSTGSAEADYYRHKLPAYSYEVFSDPEKTNVIDYAWDECVQSGDNVYVSSPYLSTPYYNQTFIYYCTELGPYYPPADDPIWGGGY